MPEDNVSIPGGFFEEANHRYTDLTSKRVLSVTQTFGILGMTDFSHINEEVLARKSALGVAVHAALQFLCEGCLDWDSVAEEAMPYVVAAETWMREQQFVSLSQEVRGVHTINGMQYGYQYDNRGTIVFRGRPRTMILDYKTTVVVSPTCRWQTAAYALAAEKLPPGERYLRCILQLRPDGTARPFYYEDRQDESSWQHMLYTAILGLNEGVYSLEAA